MPKKTETTRMFIRRELYNGQTPQMIADKLHVSRQAIYDQMAIIRYMVETNEDQSDSA